MPVWTPTEKWKDQDVFLIGGGNSLREEHFDWNLLKPELTIGCNTAFTLGPEICKICIFGDKRWFDAYGHELAKFKGAVFTLCPSLKNYKAPWLWWIPREGSGLHYMALGWNGNTGAAAINLALILGAKRVFLLGYDMRHTGGRSNWHDRIINANSCRSSVYPMFCREFRHLVRDWHKKFHDREIWNVTKLSGLSKDLIPWIDPSEFWKKRIAERELAQRGMVAI